jgi:hypothetical protein
MSLLVSNSIFEGYICIYIYKGYPEIITFHFDGGCNNEEFTSAEALYLFAFTVSYLPSAELGRGIRRYKEHVEVLRRMSGSLGGRGGAVKYVIWQR